MNTKLIQITNTAIGAIAVDALMPLGTITRRYGVGGNYPTYTTANSNVDTITINDEGYYDIAYNASLVAGAAGVLTLTLLTNGEAVYTISETVAAGDTYNMSLPFTVRVYAKQCNAPTNNPMNIQVQLGGVAVTSGTSNIQVEKRV
jgi:hypothetical protein